MAQFARPDGNITQTGFTGGFAEIDESSASDADIAWGANNTAAVLEVSLSNVSDPSSGSGHTFRYRVAKTNNGVLDGAGNAVTITAELYQGATQIAADSAKTLTGAWTTYTLALSSGQADAITDYTDLRLRFTTSNSGGNPSNRRGGGVSWAELEVPTAILSGVLVQTTEVDVSQAVARHKTKGAAQITSAEIAQAIQPSKARSVGQIAEADTSQAVAWAPKSRFVVQTLESGAAQSASPSKTLGIVQTTETDLVQGVSRPRVGTVNIIQETDTPQAVSWSPKSRLVGQISEINIPQIILPRRTYAIAQIAENDTAQALVRIKQALLVQASETSVASAATGYKTKNVGQITEVDTSQTILYPVHRLVSAPTETGLAQPITTTGQKVIAVAQALDLSAAQVILWAPKIRLVLQVVGGEVAQAIAAAKLAPIAQAAETDSSQAVTRLLSSIVVAQASEASFSQPVGVGKWVVPGLAVETSATQSVATIKVRLVSGSIEADLAQVVVTPKTITVEQIAETDLAQAITNLLVANLFANPNYTAGSARSYVTSAKGRDYYTSKGRSLDPDLSRDFTA